jgi:hypothetical protein
MRNFVSKLGAAMVFSGGIVLAACSEAPMSPTAGKLGKLGLTITGPTSFDPVEHTCPNTGINGWTKIDAGSGSANGAWGSLSYPNGPTITVNVNSGYTIEICVKSGANVNSGNAAFYTVTGPEVNGTITIAQNISHTGWRVVEEPIDEFQSLSVSKGAAGKYTRTVSWTLAKTVNGKTSETFTGLLGDVFPAVDWEVVADKTESESNYMVTGEITITNPNAVAVDVSVADVLYAGLTALGTSVAIDCDPAGGDQATGTVPAAVGGVDGTLVCTYSASPADRTADLNRADVTVNNNEDIEGGIATAEVLWTEEVEGDDVTTLADPRFTFTKEISDDDTENFAETFSCPTDRSRYTNSLYSQTFTNTATLDGENTDLEASATVTVNCRDPFVGETATGAGFPWSATKSAPSNWFMYTPWVTTSYKTGLNPGAVDLIAGQHYVVGQITGVQVHATRRDITITLSGLHQFAAVANNVKIVPLASCTASALKYIQPGQFTIKATAGGTSITLQNVGTAVCYGIHVDVLRWAP